MFEGNRCCTLFFLLEDRSIQHCCAQGAQEQSLKAHHDVLRDFIVGTLDQERR